MREQFRKSGSILLAGLYCAVFLGGCASSHSTRGARSSYDRGSLTPAEQRMREQSSTFDVKTSLQGCAAGAVAGALLGMLSKGDRSNNVMIGAAAGCGVGLAANAYVQTKRNSYQNEEQRMASMIADVRADNARLAGLISSSKEVIAADKRKLAQVDKAYRQKSISASQARRDLAGVRANRAHLQKTVDTLREKEDNWIEISELERRSGADTRGLDKEIGKLRSQVSALEKEMSLMDKQIRVSPVAA